MSEIEVSDAAVKATYGAPYTENVTNKSIRAVLESGAPVVVAAELRRLAKFLDESSDARKLLARADELDPQGGAR